MLVLDALENLLAMHGDILRRVDADPHLIALDAQHGHRHLVADHQGFAYPAGQNQHIDCSMIVRSSDPQRVRAFPRCTCRGAPRPAAERFLRIQHCITFGDGCGKGEEGQYSRAFNAGAMKPCVLQSQLMAYASAAESQPGSSSSARSSAGESTPPPCAMSGRPPPLPPICAAMCATTSPAFTLARAVPCTPPTSAILPSEPAASSTTQSPNFCFKVSAASRSDLASRPCTRAATNLISPIVCACEARSPVAALAFFAFRESSSRSSFFCRSNI